MNLFYTNEVSETIFTLRGQEAKHCAQVLRRRVGDLVIATDGLGHRIEGLISEISKEHVEVTVNRRDKVDKGYNDIHLAIGLLKDASRMEWLVEKVTEIGVASIQPLICRRSERSRVKHERLYKRMISAAKQSLKYTFPVLHEAAPYQSIVEHIELPGYVASYDPENKNLWNHNYPDKSCVMLIGPEGDFTPAELDIAMDKGFQKVNLGAYRLRTETAGVVAITNLQHR